MALLVIVAFLSACESSPVRRAARQAAGLLEQGHTEEALTAYRKAQELDRSAAVLHFGEGLALYKLRRYKEAEPPLREAIRLQPDGGQYHLYLGHVLAHLERLDEAVEAYTDATRNDPSHAETWRALGFAQYNRRHYKEARTALTRYMGLARDAADQITVSRLISTLPEDDVQKQP